LKVRNVVQFTRLSENFSIFSEQLTQTFKGQVNICIYKTLTEYFPGIEYLHVNYAPVPADVHTRKRASRAELQLQGVHQNMTTSARTWTTRSENQQRKN